MPIYMDRHDIPEHIAAKDIAKMHQEDLKAEHNYERIADGKSIKTKKR